MTGSPLTTVADVRRNAQLSGNSEITDSEISSFIAETDISIRTLYGDPTEKTFTHIRFRSIGSTIYDFTGDKRPVFRIDTIDVDGNVNVPLASFTQNLDIGEVDFSSAFLEEFDGERLDFEYVPSVFNLLSTYMSAKAVLETTTVIIGADQRHPRIDGLKRKIDEVKEILAPKGLTTSTKWANWDPRQGRHVDQDFEGIY